LIFVSILYTFGKISLPGRGLSHTSKINPIKKIITFLTKRCQRFIPLTILYLELFRDSDNILYSNFSTDNRFRNKD